MMDILHNKIPSITTSLRIGEGHFTDDNDLGGGISKPRERAKDRWGCNIEYKLVLFVQYPIAWISDGLL